MRNITEDQEALLTRLYALDPDLIVRWDEGRGVASSVRGELSRATEGEPQQALLAFLAAYGEVFGCPNPEGRLRQVQSKADELGWTHLEYQDTHPHPATQDAPRRRRRGRDERIDVYGSRIAAHFGPDGGLVEVQSSCWRETRLEADELKVSESSLPQLLADRIANAPGIGDLRERAAKLKERQFPVLRPPQLVVYPWQAAFRLVWMTYTYGVVEELDRDGQPTGRRNLEQGQVFVDGTTGEVLLFASLARDAETADTGSGLAVTPIGGTFTSRSLRIVRVDTTSRYLLRDTTHARDIVTYDAANSDDYNTDNERRDGLNSGTLPVSEDTDGDKNWSRTPSNTTVAERTASQQPEVDLHHFIRDAYEWYDALAGGRAGLDNGQYPNPPVPPQVIRSIAHAKDGTNASSINAGARLNLVSGNWLSWIQFFDGDRTTYDYLAGSRFIVGHEYQHSITDFSFEDSAGNPGLTYSDWLAAVHEGLSDVFGCLLTDQWLPATEISPVGQIFRNLVYPRDDGPPPATAAYDANNTDHFADRNLTTGTNGRYRRGTILAHAAYLMGKGGVHQRASRTPALIPVYGMGRQVVGGRDVLRAARIWYRAVAHYFSTHGALTGIPANDENTFRTLRNGCVSAAIDIFGTGSREHLNAVLAFYAVGLHPTGTTYGADPTFLRWGADWPLSRPYIGISSPDWSSVDLFINNGGASEWNALNNVIDSSGNPTTFENTIYCRVRNVGDAQAQNVQVQLSYAKAGTGVVSWLPVTDASGNIQILNVGNLAAGQPNFPDSQQNSPPASASVKWYIPPLAAGETVHHYCLRATVTSLSDVNPHNNEVQSNIAYAPYSPGGGFVAGFLAGNPTDEEIKLDLDVRAHLPRGWRVSIEGLDERRALRPGEELPLEVRIDMPAGADRQLEPPFDGQFLGEAYGCMTGPLEGTLSETVVAGQVLTGRFAARLGELGTIVGGFEGRFQPLSGEIEGRVDGQFACAGKHGSECACVGVKGCLRPFRRVDITQRVGGEPIGGLTVQVQVPGPGSCRIKLPPASTFVDDEADGGNVGRGAKPTSV